MRAAAAMAAFLLVASIIVGAIIIAPLDETRAELFAVVHVKPKLVAPLNKMGLFENILVVSAAPNEYFRRLATEESARNQ